MTRRDILSNNQQLVNLRHLLSFTSVSNWPRILRQKYSFCSSLTRRRLADDGRRCKRGEVIMRGNLLGKSCALFAASAILILCYHHHHPQQTNLKVLLLQILQVLVHRCMFYKSLIVCSIDQNAKKRMSRDVGTLQKYLSNSVSVC